MEEISKRARLVRDLVYQFNHNSRLKGKLVEDTRSVSEMDKAFRYPDYIHATRIKLDNFEMELIKRNHEEYDAITDELTSDDANYAARDAFKLVVLQLHGGGYVNAFKNTYRTMAGLYCEVGGGADVLSIDYRVAPENPYPAALEDAVCAYEWLLENGYKENQIIVAGDSAGGGLAMALCHFLKDNKRTLPAGIVAMSPWTDLAITGASYVENKEIDPIFGDDEGDLIYENPYAGEHDKKEPYISPLYGDFTDFPPMLIQVGTHEMLLSDSLSVAEKAKQAGVKVRYTEYEGMFHVFQMAAKIMPESRQAWSEVHGFLNVIRGIES